MAINIIYILASLITGFSSAMTECGVKRSSSRIVGGTDSGGYHYPWFALLVLKNNEDIPVCAGSLITSRHVLTAAHCFNFDPTIPNEDLFNVLMGIYDRCNHNEPNRQAFTVSQVFVHEKYMPQNKFYDIAVLTLNRPADFTVICLPIPGTGGNDITEPAVLVGFGMTEEGGREAPCHLIQAYITKYSKNDCKHSDLPKEDIEEKTVICAGRIQGGIDSCQGDSGGPLQILTSTGKYILAGIVSYGYGCANPGLPGLYTDVASYLNWIEDRTGIKLKNQNDRMHGRIEIALKRPDNSPRRQAIFPNRRTNTVRDSIKYTSTGTVRFPGRNTNGNEHFNDSEETTSKLSTVSFPDDG